MNVCTYECMYIWRYVHTKVCTYECMYIRRYVHTNVCTYECMYIRMYVHTNVCTYECMYIRMYVHTNVCTFECMYIWMYVHMNVCTYECRMYNASRLLLQIHKRVYLPMYVLLYIVNYFNGAKYPCELKLGENTSRNNHARGWLWMNLHLYFFLPPG
jgi:hypothetical protein